MAHLSLPAGAIGMRHLDHACPACLKLALACLPSPLRRYVEEMVRVLKPGGTLVIACWCQREETPGTPFTEDERDKLQFLYDEWAHPYFISIQEFERLMKVWGNCGESGKLVYRGKCEAGLEVWRL